MGGARISRKRWETQLLAALASAPGVTTNLWQVTPEAALSDAELDAHLAEVEVAVSRRDIYHDTAELNRDRIRGAYRALRDIGPLTHDALREHADDNANVITSSDDANWREVVLPTLAELPGVTRPPEEGPEWAYQRSEGEAVETCDTADREGQTAKYQTGTDEQEPAHGVTL